MEKGNLFWETATICLGVLSLALALALLVALQPPEPVRLRGTYGTADGMCVVFFAPTGKEADGGEYAIYPDGYPYEASVEDEGAFEVYENGVVRLNSSQGQTYYAAVKGDGGLWLFWNREAPDFCSKRMEAPVMPS